LSVVGWTPPVFESGRPTGLHPLIGAVAPFAQCRGRHSVQIGASAPTTPRVDMRRVRKIKARITELCTTILSAQHERHARREELARCTCTLQLGSVVTVRDRRSGNATFRGRVQLIWPGSELSEWELQEGKDPVGELYRIYGVRLRKDGSDGSQTFEASDREVIAEEAES
jgi:hypothetical protein